MRAIKRHAPKKASVLKGLTFSKLSPCIRKLAFHWIRESKVGCHDFNRFHNALVNIDRPYHKHRKVDLSMKTFSCILRQ